MYSHLNLAVFPHSYRLWLASDVEYLYDCEQVSHLWRPKKKIYSRFKILYIIRKNKTKQAHSKLFFNVLIQNTLQKQLFDLNVIVWMTCQDVSLQAEFVFGFVFANEAFLASDFSTFVFHVSRQVAFGCVCLKIKQKILFFFLISESDLPTFKSNENLVFSRNKYIYFSLNCLFNVMIKYRKLQTNFQSNAGKEFCNLWTSYTNDFLLAPRKKISRHWQAGHVTYVRKLRIYD